MTEKFGKTDFLKDVSEHQMTILRDDGLYRHVQFRKPETVIMGFDLITWPGYLCFCGDMGTYVFRRLADMFLFFRSPDLSFNASYWGQKCESVDRDGAIKEYSPEKARKVIEEWVDDFDVSNSIRQAVKDEILSRVDNGEERFREAVDDFEHEGFQFHDFWDVNLREYSDRFIWCCYALAWGIDQYDNFKIHHNETRS